VNDNLERASVVSSPETRRGFLGDYWPGGQERRDTRPKVVHKFHDVDMAVTLFARVWNVSFLYAYSMCRGSESNTLINSRI